MQSVSKYVEKILYFGQYGWGLEGSLSKHLSHGFYQFLNHNFEQEFRFVLTGIKDFGGRR